MFPSRVENYNRIPEYDGILCCIVIRRILALIDVKITLEEIREVSC